MKTIESDKCITYVEQTNSIGQTHFSVHPKGYINRFDIWISCTTEMQETAAKIINDHATNMLKELKTIGA
jgi:hypothetical protein